MLISMAIVLVVLAFADIVSGVFTSRFIERLRAELFDAVEEQRQAFRQLRQANAELKSVEQRKEMAQHKCDELQQTLSRFQARIDVLSEGADHRKSIHVRGHRPN